MLNHKEFLADGVNNPRRQFAETLVDGLAWSDDPIIVYSAHEYTRLRELAADFPDLSTALNAHDYLLTGRLAAEPYGEAPSTSNRLLQLCAARLGWGDDLEDIADGGAASAAFLQLASGHIAHPGEADQLRAELLAYCKRDTLAMVEVHRALAQLDFS